MKTANPFPSLQITSPFGGVFWRTVALLLLVILGGEAVIRAGVWFKLWPEPELGSINAELDIKIQSLDSLTRTETIDCIFLGSSQMDAAINPDVFSTEYRRLTGENLNCFNFSLGTLTAGPAGKMARLLVNRYHPKILVLGISARDFSRDFGELSRSFKDDPWVRYSLGELNIPGWVTENSFFFRLASQLRSRLNPDYMDFHTGLLRSIKPRGYLYRDGNDLSIDSASSIPKYALFAEDIAGLDEVLAINNESVSLLVLEIPVFPGFLDSYVENDPDDYFTLFREPIQERIAEAGVPFILSQEMVTRDIPDADWNDILHLNFRGADTFCRWFAQEAAAILVKEISMGTLQ